MVDVEKLYMAHESIECYHCGEKISVGEYYVNVGYAGNSRALRLHRGCASEIGVMLIHEGEKWVKRNEQV